jgi:hypothetical protein
MDDTDFFTQFYTGLNPADCSRLFGSAISYVSQLPPPIELSPEEFTELGALTAESLTQASRLLASDLADAYKVEVLPISKTAATVKEADGGERVVLLPKDPNSPKLEMRRLWSPPVFREEVPPFGHRMAMDVMPQAVAETVLARLRSPVQECPIQEGDAPGEGWFRVGSPDGEDLWLKPGWLRCYVPTKDGDAPVLVPPWKWIEQSWPGVRDGAPFGQWRLTLMNALVVDEAKVFRKRVRVS